MRAEPHHVAAIDANIQQLLGQLRAQGVLDDQFGQLMQLQDESNPDFVAEVVQLYFEDAVSKIDKIQGILAAPAPDFVELDALVHQFKGSSASLGAQTIARLCIRLRGACQSRDGPAVHALLNEVRQAYAVLKSNLDLFMQLETQRKQLTAAGRG